MRLIWLVLNAIAPASGLHAVGYSKLAWFTGVCVLMLWSGLTYSRLIVHPAGLIGFLVALVLVVLVVSIVIWRLFNARHAMNVPRQAVLHVILSLAALLYISANFKQVHGIEVYYIPSASMTPTIRVGEVVLADTTAGAIKRVNPEDIVAFEHSKLGRDDIWIKRVTELAEHEMSMAGDNSSASVNTRYLQDIPRANIHGVVKTVIGTYTPSHFTLGVRMIE